MSASRQVRCAIYTRKSSDEGLEQSFNSLDAQREACAAYILSQASEGWVSLPDRHDDGGLSGGTLERPALKRLLADIVAGRIDVVVVYKVDRLTRSLLDFSKLVERFEANATSFISITQSFNTTSSMGRLTLNMLLSFAQFEREVTAERIRDKIAASKARGMWMGGIPPLGYRPDGRSLTIVEDHAALVRHIFERYLALGTVRLLADELDRTGHHAPSRTTATGKVIGGRPLSRGQLYLMLNCLTYRGEIRHKDRVYPGLHPAIIDRDTWEQVQAQLAAHVRGSRDRVRAAQSSPLAGKLVDAAGEPLIAVHAGKSGGEGGRQRYRYYVSRALHHKQSEHGLRIPARMLERLVATNLAELLDDPLALLDRTGLEVRADRIGGVDGGCRMLGARLRQGDPALLGTLVTEVKVGEDQIELGCNTTAIAAALDIEASRPEPLMLTIAAMLRRSGRALRLIRADGCTPEADPNAALVRLLVLARAWWGELRTGTLDVTALALREQRSPSYVTRVVRLAFLSPAVTRAILAGKQRDGVDVARLTLGEPLPVLWSEQARLLLAGATL